MMKPNQTPKLAPEARRQLEKALQLLQQPGALRLEVLVAINDSRSADLFSRPVSHKESSVKEARGKAGSEEERLILTLCCEGAFFKVAHVQELQEA